MTAKIISASRQAIVKCASVLQRGGLVAFPTETVYGLGANALDAAAVASIFKAKGRPRTDPLIVHVASRRAAEPLIKMSEMQRQIFDILSTEFWPGPLTLVVPATELVPCEVTGGGQTVGIRMPSHTIALQLLEEAGIPIAAPSANRFGHVSPTSAMHVMDDLFHVEKLLILEDTKQCEVGLESTVVKITETGALTILRPGAVTAEMLTHVCQKNPLLKPPYIFLADKDIPTHTSLPLESPGRLLTHYAPFKETFILLQKERSIKKAEEVIQALPDMLASSVIIDFASRAIHLAAFCRGYYDLSMQGDKDEAGRNLFFLLRLAEKIPGVNFICLPDIQQEEDDTFSQSLADRIFRAASGRYVTGF